MSTDTSSALEQPTKTAPTPTPPRDKVKRIAIMTRHLLDEVHAQPPDAASLERLRSISAHITDELLGELTPDLREELQRLALPLTRHAELSDAELRLAHAQLAGWLEGFVQTTQTFSDPHTVAANDFGAVQSAPDDPDRPHVKPCSPTTPVPDDSAPSQDDAAIRSARQALITAITRRITQQRLTAAHAAAALGLTGPKTTQLLRANIDEFTLDELVAMLPAVQLTIQVVPLPEQDARSSG